MPSLARVEAVERAALLDVLHYRLMLDLAGAGPHFLSDTTITFRAERPGARTFLDLRPAAIDSIELNGLRVEPAGLVDGRLWLEDLQPHNVLRVVARMAYSTDGEGLHRTVDPADARSYLYAMSFLDAAPRWFACFDQPDLKARYDIEVRCPQDWSVFGNSPASKIGPGQWRLATSQPLATYFVTLVAGPYESVFAEHDGIRLGLHARASLSPQLRAEAAEILEVTRASFDRLHELFGIRYPFGEYHQAFVADFNAGAMENPGCVTLREQFLFRAAATLGERRERAVVIAHEMTHMWFGDLVTMRWWDDLWLNESFAEYLGYRVRSETVSPAVASRSWVDFGIDRKHWGQVADQAPSTHPVAGNGSATAEAALADFDGISYAKGASVLKQLAEQLGDEVFFGGLRDYFTRHLFGNAEFGDLIAAWTAAGASGLDEWAAAWLRTTGLDTLEAAVDEGIVTVRRNAPGASGRLHAVRLAGFDAAGTQVLDLPLQISADVTQVAAPPSTLLVVADGLDQTWAKLRFGPQGWPALQGLLPAIGQDLTRVVVYNALRDSVRDAELDPEAALDTLLRACLREPIELVTAELLTFATQQLAGNFCRPAQRAGRRNRIYQVTESLLEQAEPGSDAQLVAARALIAACDSPARLRAWRSEEDLPAGLRIDVELRWALVSRLAALGDLAEQDIEDELAKDASTAGAVHAARSRALLPDAAAKERAWRLLVEPSAMTAYELYGTAQGFFEPSQHSLTEPYLARFFDQMPETARHREGWALGRIILSAFPTAAASEPTLQLAQQALQRPDLAPAVRRAFSDGTDTLARCTASLRRFPGAC